MCQNYKCTTRCKYDEKCQFRHIDAEEMSSKKSKEGSAKGSVALLKEEVQLGCVSQDSNPKKSILRKVGTTGIERVSGTQRKILRRHLAPNQNSGKPSRGIIQKCEPHERSLCAPRFEERSHEETSKQESWSRRAAWDLAKDIYKL